MKGEIFTFTLNIICKLSVKVNGKNNGLPTAKGELIRVV